MASERAAKVLDAALRQGLLSEEDTAVFFYDLNRIRERVAGIAAAFPESALHAVAVKANPLRRVIERIVAQGAGAEAASLPELELALRAGCPPSRLVFDSPAKTRLELARALDRDACINADGLEELELIDGLLLGRTPRNFVGLRVNPQVGAGAIAATSVAAGRSKFGVPIERREEVKTAFERFPWLSGLHLHVGSQGCGLELLVEGARRVFMLAEEVNAARPGQVRVLDIGGGLPVSFDGGPDPVPVAVYAQALREACPGLFDRYRLVTEFGRYVHAGAGFAVSRVAAVKRHAEGDTAVLHLGADLFVRECYMPGVWPHRVAAFDPEGRPREGALYAWDLAGPLCFAGDYPIRGAALPDLAVGDFVAVLDAGAYCLAMWSRYNSRQTPLVLGVEGAGPFRFSVLKAREKVEAVLSFWE